MSPEQYRAACDAVNNATYDTSEGADDWNMQYLMFLHANGLKLAKITGIGRPAEPHHIQAPWPSPDGPLAWLDSWIVPRGSKVTPTRSDKGHGV